MTLTRPRSAPTGFRLLATAALLAIAAGLGGCRLFHGEPGGVLTATSTSGGKSFAPDFTTGAYFGVDGDTADVFLSDIPQERFLNARDTLADASGSIFHIHMFLIPEAGQTPIDATACNITVRHLVLAGAGRGRGVSDTPVMGLYAGGGFLLPNKTIGSGSLSGSINGATQRLTRSTPDFTDLIGAGEMSGRFSADEDEALAQAISRKLEGLVSLLPAPRLEEEADDKPAPAKAPDPKKNAKKGEPADAAKSPAK